MQDCRERECKPHPFSIAALLGDRLVSVREEETSAYKHTQEVKQNGEFEENEISPEADKEAVNRAKSNDRICANFQYSWLHCSRYNPPRVQSKYAKQSEFGFHYTSSC